MSSLSTLSKDDEMVTIPLDTIFSRPSKHAPVLTWKDVGFSVPIRKSKEHKRIIEKCSGYAKAGQMIAIMGGSGAGKSTLLNCLSGRLGPGLLQGQVLINGGPRNPNTWKTQCAYVEQEDILYQNLTVHETLTYSALLRLPQSVSIAEKSKRVDEIIQQLGLNDCKDVPVGNSESKGISGGQRKRLTIGGELVTNPDILFLDEPTSGLDAFNAFNVIETIKKVAIEQGKIVILTIHQPRTDILQLFDKIILMSAGRTVWNGTVPDALAHFEKLGYALPPNTNPSDFFIDIVTIDQRTEELEKKSLARISVFISSWEYEFSKLDYEPKIIPAIDETDNSSSVWPTSRINEIKVLLQRNMKDVMRDKASIAATVGQAIIVMILLGILFFRMDLSQAGVQNRVGLLFFIAINQMFSNIMPTIVVFPLQREIIKRERAAGTYRSSSAYIAKFISTLPLNWLGSFVFSLPLYWIVGLQNSAMKYLYFIIIILVHSNVSNALGIMISSFVPSVQVGQIVAPLFAILMILFGTFLLC